ncbi:hypothetical protein MMC26_000918 [Xylographa opegraphella]|nr:hypothetical protein [Xylographa opegraphella]
MAHSTGTAGWLPPHLRVLQSQSSSNTETNRLIPHIRMLQSPSPVNAETNSNSPEGSVLIIPQSGLGNRGDGLTENPGIAPRLQPTENPGSQSTSSAKNECSPPHPCTIIEQKPQPWLPAATVQQWRACLDAHLEKYRSGNVPKASAKNLSGASAKVSSMKPQASQLPLHPRVLLPASASAPTTEASPLPPHLRVLLPSPASAFNTQAKTLATASSIPQEKAIQPSSVSNSAVPRTVPFLTGSLGTSSVPNSHSTYTPAITEQQGISVSNITMSYPRNFVTKLELLPAHLKTPTSSNLTRAHLADLDRTTVTTKFSIASVSPETTTQMARKPKIDEEMNQEIQFSLPASTSTFPPASIRTGDTVTGTKQADMPELLKMSRNYPCPYEDCRLGFDTLKEIRMHKVEMHDYCRRCDKDFKDSQDYLDHKIESPEHIACPICGEDFRSNGGRDVHIRTIHPNPQNLNCPGCGSKFVRAGSLIDHIEKNRCMRISVEQFERYRASHAIKNAQLLRLGMDEDDIFFAMTPNEKTMEEVADLVTKKGDDEGEPGSVTLAMNEVVLQESEHGIRKATMASVLASQADANGGTSLRNMNVSLHSEFPPLGDTKARQTAGPLAATQAGPQLKIPVWSTPGSTPHKVIVEKAKQNPKLENQDIQSLPTRYSHPILTEMTTGSGSTKSGLTFSNGSPVDAIDPNSSNYNPDEFMTIIGTWKCPYPKCGKSFPTRLGFTSHQRSPAHKGVDHRCPDCLRIYRNATALTQHMESATSRCRIKLSKDYDRVLGMVSGGIIRVDGQHVDGTVRYEAGEPEW